jgi:hypothetical protein
VTSTASGGELEKITRDHGEHRERAAAVDQLPEELAGRLVAGGQGAKDWR